MVVNFWHLTRSRMSSCIQAGCKRYFFALHPDMEQDETPVFGLLHPAPKQESIYICHGGLCLVHPHATHLPLYASR